MIAGAFAAARWRVTVIDGFVPGTGGRRENLRGLASDVTLIDRRVEHVRSLRKILGQNDLVVDCMAMTSHLRALRQPLLDLELNAASHLHLIQAIPTGKAANVLYLGSRSQYGRQHGEIHESTPCVPT